MLASASVGDVTKVESYLRDGADIECFDSDGCTALRLAAERGNIQCVRLLIERGANVESKANNGMTPLLGAACGDKIECIKFLVEVGADIYANTNGWSVMHYCARDGNFESFVFLLEAGCDIYCKDDEGKTPLDIAGNFATSFRKIETGRRMIMNYMVAKSENVALADKIAADARFWPFSMKF